MSLLVLRCKSCATTFPSGIRTGVFGVPRVGTMERRCPACRAAAYYDADDYVLHPRAASAG